MPFQPPGLGWGRALTRLGQVDDVGRANPVAFAVIPKRLHDVTARGRGPACRHSNRGCPSGRSFGTMGSGVLRAWRRPWIFRVQAGLWGRAAVTRVGGVCPEGPMPGRRGGRGPHRVTPGPWVGSGLSSGPRSLLFPPVMPLFTARQDKGPVSGAWLVSRPAERPRRVWEVPWGHR